MNPAALRTTVVVDYQNVHLTGHGLFASTKYRPKHEALIAPLRFATELVTARNAAQRERPKQARVEHAHGRSCFRAIHR